MARLAAVQCATDRSLTSATLMSIVGGGGMVGGGTTPSLATRDPRPSGWIAVASRRHVFHLGPSMVQVLSTTTFIQNVYVTCRLF